MGKGVKTVLELRDYMLHYLETRTFPTRKAALEYAVEKYKADTKVSFYAIEDERFYSPYRNLHFRYIGNIKLK